MTKRSLIPWSCLAGVIVALGCSDDTLNPDPASGGSAGSGVAGASGGGASGTSGTAGGPTGGASATGGASGTAGSGAGGASGTSGAGGTAGAAAGMGGSAGTGAGGTAGVNAGAAGAGNAGVGGSSGDAGNAGAAGSAGNAGTAGTAGGAGSAGQGGSSGAAGSGGAAGSSGAGGTSGAAGSGSGDCMVPPQASPLVGWASVNQSNQNGTTGGGSATPVVVTSTQAFNSAAGGSNAAVIHVSGSLSGSFTIGSNKTVIGVCGAVLQGSVRISGSVNVILRNIKVVGNNCSDSPNDCSGGADAVAITNGAHHVWVDHADVSDGSDGNLDVNAGSDLVTISWTKFSYSTRRTDPDAGASGHRFSNLIGSGDDVTTDAGKLRVTFHHSWWADNIDQRMPRTRFGDIHVFNNLYTAAGNSYCTNAGIQTNLLVENNVYNGVNRPLSPDANGDMLARGNLFINTNPAQPTATGVGFTPPYQYTLDATDNLEATIRAQAGPR